MIKGFEHVGDEHKCNVCSSEFTEDEGGVLGYFAYCLWHFVLPATVVWWTWSVKI